MISNDSDPCGLPGGIQSENQRVDVVYEAATTLSLSTLCGQKIIEFNP
jgi:hypothetical protein